MGGRKEGKKGQRKGDGRRKGEGAQRDSCPRVVRIGSLGTSLQSSG